MNEFADLEFSTTFSDLNQYFQTRLETIAWFKNKLFIQLINKIIQNCPQRKFGNYIHIIYYMVSKILFHTSYLQNQNQSVLNNFYAHVICILKKKEKEKNTVK